MKRHRRQFWLDFFNVSVLYDLYGTPLSLIFLVCFFSCFQVFKISRWRVCVLSVLKVVYLLWVDLLASSTVLQLPLPTASFIICSANSAPSFSFARYISRLIRFWCPRIRLCETLFSPFRHRSMSKRLKWKRVVVIRIMEDKCCGERCVRNLFMSCLSFWLLL